MVYPPYEYVAYQHDWNPKESRCPLPLYMYVCMRVWVFIHVRMYMYMPVCVSARPVWEWLKASGTCMVYMSNWNKYSWEQAHTYTAHLKLYLESVIESCEVTAWSVVSDLTARAPSTGDDGQERLPVVHTSECIKNAIIRSVSSPRSPENNFPQCTCVHAGRYYFCAQTAYGYTWAVG